MMKRFTIAILVFVLCTATFAKNAPKTLIAYFSFPITGGKEALDATSGASVVPNSNGMGNAEFIALTIAKVINADVFKIDTGDHYPHDYNKIFDITNAEQRKKVKPKLVSHVADMKKYNTVIICCPVWWYKMPLAVQAFLDEYDLSGKTIYLSVTHGGSRSGGIEREIAAAEPKATISKNMLILNRSEIGQSEKKIIDWAKGLGL
ncbi:MULTISPECIES: flavodoxin [Treponema]|uniref:flavodoxin n=1 Tax=Treponema TaxID=157 RepID=UPI0002B55A65|nr:MULTISPECIES: flavodoxin [Treponema]EMB46059.1 hypothetical protein HMPREF9729_01260 [Treponema denticola ASLM]EMD57377.1 hypothetical protein HMPREF9728_00438 [Treponema denticola US-Trep]UTD11012.1 NAD(P)H-dependent oxidoreductase [Treponema sp. B152]